jgi:UDP-N-acetyl-D-glucosamine dehydrogenase
MKNELLKKIENREIVVGVVGLGYVGLPLAVEKPKQVLRPLVLTFSRRKLKWSMPDIIILEMLWTAI